MAGKYLGRGRMQVGRIEESVDPGKWKKWSIGIDVHKMMLICAVLIPDYNLGQIQKYSQKFDTDRSSLESLRNWLLEFKKELGPAEFVIESTATYHRPVFYMLRDHFDLILVNPVLAGEGKKKADKYDAGLLAYHGLTGLWKKSYIFPLVQEQCKTVSRRYEKAKNRFVSASNSIGTTLLNYNILISREIKVFSASGQVIIDAIAAGETDPCKIVISASYFRSEGTEEKRDKRKRLMKALEGLSDLPDSVRDVIGKLTEDARHAEQRMIWYNEKLHQIFEEYIGHYPDGRVLTANQISELIVTMPGAGVRLADVLISEAGLEIERRFEEPGRFIAFCGLDPSKRYSADKVTSAKGRVGNVHIHSAVIQCAQALLQVGKKDCSLAAWGRAFKSRNGGDIKAHNAACAAVAKRMVTAAYNIMIKAVPYCEDMYDFGRHKTDALKKVRSISRQIADLKRQIKPEEADNVVKAAATEAICSINELIGMEGGFILNPDVPDKRIDELPFRPRTKNVLLKAGIDRISVLWFNLTQGKLMNIEKFGKKSYEETVDILIKNKFITARSAK